MTIRRFLMLFFIVGMVISSFFCYKYLRGKIIEDSTKPLVGFYVNKIQCSSAIRESSVLEVNYNHKNYYVSISKGKCSDIKKGIIDPNLYYDKDNDTIFFEGQYFPLPYVLLFYGIVFILTSLGLIVYRKELNNHYSSI